MSKFPSRPGITASRNKRKIDKSVDDIVAPIAAEIEHDRNDLLDFYHWCRKRNREYFKGMSLAEFEKWNLARIAALDIQPPIETTEQARARIEAGVSGQAGKWNPVTKRLEFSAEPKKVVPLKPN